MTTTRFNFEKKKAVGVKSILTQGSDSSQGACQNRLYATESQKAPNDMFGMTNLVTNGREVSKPLYINKKQVGIYNPTTKQFIKPVTRSKHYFRKVSGYAVDSGVLDYLEDEGGQEVLIVETDTGNSFKSNLQTWKEKGRAGNWGYGKQQTLSEKYMERLGFEG